jgi:hypothetical protein
MSQDQLDVMRNKISALVPLAIDTLGELAVAAERDNVRLAAAEAILDRAGLARNAKVEVTATAAQHVEATEIALALVERLARNKAALQAPTPELDTLLVLEDAEDELPVAGDVKHFIEAQEAHHSE